MLTAGGEVWMGDETTLREMPPLRGAWAKRGAQAVVVISGRNSRRVLHGALHVRMGARVPLICEHSCQDDSIAFLHELSAHRPGVPKRLIWDNAMPPHHPRRVLQAAAAAGIVIAWLPFRSPELNPCEDVWLRLKGRVAANRVYDQVADLAAASSWLSALTPAQILRSSGLRSSKFQWLPT